MTVAKSNDVEGMLMMAVEALYKEDRELDVQMGLLRVVLQVLQRHGRRAEKAQHEHEHDPDPDPLHTYPVINTEC